VKKLVSIGVALALLTMAVVPGAVAAEEITPDTFAKIPFAIIGTGLQLAGDLLDILGPELELPAWLNSSLTEPMAQWAAGPLSWTVDMLAWAATLGGSLMALISDLLGDIPIDLEGLFNTIACGLFQGYESISGNFTDPCTLLPS